MKPPGLPRTSVVGMSSRISELLYVGCSARIAARWQRSNSYDLTWRAEARYRRCFPARRRRGGSWCWRTELGRGWVTHLWRGWRANWLAWAWPHSATSFRTWRNSGAFLTRPQSLRRRSSLPCEQPRRQLLAWRCWREASPWEDE